jgi:hypothetical protein
MPIGSTAERGNYDIGLYVGLEGNTGSYKQGKVAFLLLESIQTEIKVELR